MTWLVGHWFRNRSRGETFVLLLVMMLALGWLTCRFNLEKTMFVPITAYYCLYVVILLLSVMLTARFCRDRCTVRRFLGWLIVWNSLVAYLAFLAYGAICLCELPKATSLGPAHWLLLLPLLGCFIQGSLLYLLNLPFLILAFRSPFYRKRFEYIFGGEARNPSP